MSLNNLIFTREELYQKVWTIPVHKLAQDLGISDVGLAKLCRRHSIPVPGRGYWARLAAGQKPKRPILPKSEGVGLDRIEIHPNARRAIGDFPREKEQSITEIEVAPDRPITHPLCLASERSILHSPNEKGILVARKGRVIPLAVSSESFSRALRILDALFFTLEEAGYTLTWPKPYDSEMKIAVLDEAFRFSLVEIVKSLPHEPTADEKRHSWISPRRDYRPTGLLKLSIDCQLDARIRHSWSDNTILHVEKCLGRFLAALPLIAQALKIERAEHARREREWEEQRKREENARRLREECNRRIRVIQKLAKNWGEARRIAEFAAKLRQVVEKSKTVHERRTDLFLVADFALSCAELLDPFTDLNWLYSQFNDPPWS